MRRAGRFISPAAGALARSRSSRASVSVATASSRARKGLFLPLILGIAPLSLALWFLYQVLYLSDNQSPARNAIEGTICGARHYRVNGAGDLALSDRRARRILARGRVRRRSPAAGGNRHANRHAMAAGERRRTGAGRSRNCRRD